MDAAKNDEVGGSDRNREEAIETGSKSDEFRISRTARTTATTTATTAGVTGIRYVARFIMYPQRDKPAWGFIYCNSLMNKISGTFQIIMYK